MNSPVDTTNILHDYRFGTYSMLRCCQRRERRFEGRAIRVRRAPEPSNILWENQDLAYKWRLMRKLLVGLVCFLLIVVSFVLAFLFNSAAQAQSGSTHLLIPDEAGGASCNPKVSEPADTAVQTYQCFQNATAWDP